MPKRSWATVAALASATGGSVVAIMLSSSEAAPTQTPPGLAVGGLSAGGLDRAGLTRALRTAASTGAEDLVVRLGRRTATIPRSEVGISLDVAATVDRALASASETGSAHAVSPVLSIDEDALGRSVATLVARAALEPKDADLLYDEGEIRVVAPADGQTADAVKVRAALLSMGQRLPMPSTVTAPVEPEPVHTTVEDLDASVRRARELIARPPVLVAGTRRVTVKPSLLGPALTVVTHHRPGAHETALALRAQDDALVPSLVRALSRAATEPRLSAPSPEAELTEQGSVSWRPRSAEVTFVAPGRAGQRVTREQVQRALAGLLPDGSPDTGVVAATRREPITTDDQARSVNAALGTFTTSFQCCQPRVHNIKLIAKTIDGTLIPPGQSFSLNGIIGPRTKAKGYVEAPFILDGELSTDVGGGVSQFATTVLNAAYFAGLPIDRHKAHSFWISRYPAGREATVNYPTIDLRWTNDTAAPILVRARVASTSLTVTVYGRDDGRAVTSMTSARKKVPGKDFRVTVTRITALPGRPERRETWTTTYNEPPEDE